MQFEVIGEDDRGHEGDEESAEGAAGGDRKVIARQATRTWAEAEDFAVADHAGHEYRAEVDRRERRDARMGFGGMQVVRHCDEEKDEQRQPEAAMIPARAVEADDEREQVKAERQHPEEGHDGDVLAELVGDREEQHHAACRQGEPQQFAHQRRRFAAVVGRRRRRVSPGALPDFISAPTGESCVEGEPDGPPVGLGLARELRLEHERIHQEREEGADVGQRVEAIGRDPGVGFAEPSLKQRAGGREHEVRQPKAGEEQQEDVAGGVRTVRRLPLVGRGDRQEGDREGEQAKVRDDLTARRQAADAEVGVGVAAEEQHLEEEHAGRPDGGAAAEPR